MHILSLRISICCCLLLGVAQFTQAQRTWIYYQPQHTFLYLPADSIPHAKTTMQSMLVLDSLAGDTLQILPLPELGWDMSVLYPAGFTRFDDLNFDGHPDLCVRTNSELAYVSEYACWLYRPNTQLFEADTALSSVWNLLPMPEHELLHSVWRIGLTEFGHALYGWRDGKLMLLAEEIESIPPWETEEAMYVTRRWRKDGMMVEEEFRSTEQRAYHHQKDCALLPLVK